MLAEVLYTPIRLLILLYGLGMSIYYHITDKLTMSEYWSNVNDGSRLALAWEYEWIVTGKLPIEEIEHVMGFESEET
jgi:hypothetical protein